MQVNKIASIFRNDFPDEIVAAMLENYLKILQEFRKENWMYAGAEAGQFIECCRRLIEYKLNQNYVSLADKLPIFNEKVLLQWENSSSTICEEYRIILPRILYSMYCVRNKRGMIHKNHIDPNRMDATLLIFSCKWVLAEFARLSSSLTFQETSDLVDTIMYRETSIAWDTGKLIRILDNNMNCTDKIICLLYQKNNQTVQELFQSIEYSNLSTFRGILLKLHKDRYIEYSQSICTISPKGIRRAEELMQY